MSATARGRLLKLLPPHGTRNRYQHRVRPCRCRRCRAANAAYQAARRAARRAQNVARTGVGHVGPSDAGLGFRHATKLAG